jgi:hypothetical protein
MPQLSEEASQALIEVTRHEKRFYWACGQKH